MAPRTNALVPGLKRPVTALEYARQRGLDPGRVVSQVRDGELPGVRHGRVWYVDTDPSGHARPNVVLRRAITHGDRWRRADSVAVLGMWAAICAFTFVIRLLEFKTGRHITSRRYRLSPFSDPRTWADAFSEILKDVAFLELLALVALGASVVIVWKVVKDRPALVSRPRRAARGRRGGR